MIKTIIGLVLLLIPFLFINRLNDKKLGYFYILSFLIFFHLIIAIITQTFGIFNYWLIVLINLVLCAAVIFKTNLKNTIEIIKKVKIDWICVFLIIIVFIELYSVHYNYSGKVTTINGAFKDVENMKYSYPYYSDEWSAVSFIKYSIISGKLPFANPLWHDNYFPNPEFAFHSFLAEFFLLLDLDTLTSYSVFAIFSGILICLLVYFILRLNNIARFPSVIASLLIPYIVNSANLPGIWYLMPITLGLISFLLSFLFISLNKDKMVIFTSFLVLIFYPPLFIMSFFSILFYLIFRKISLKEKIKYFSFYFIVCIIAALIISFKIFLKNLKVVNTLNFIFSKLYYITFTRDSIPDYSIWKVVPLIALVFSILGLKYFKKKLWLIAPIIIGLVYWILYSFIFPRFIIEYQRVVYVTSVLIVILSGFGISYFFEYIVNGKNFSSKFLYFLSSQGLNPRGNIKVLDYIDKKGFIKDKKILKFLFILILLVFFVLTFFYTQRSNWQELKLNNLLNNLTVIPAPPANNYLHPDDLNLFKDIKQKQFIAPPWKGLVIGVATNNYPLETKASTLTNSILKFSEFFSADCKNKSRLAGKYKISYVYSNKFDCPDFKLIGKSSEGLYLYKYK